MSSQCRERRELAALREQTWAVMVGTGRAGHRDAALATPLGSEPQTALKMVD